MASLPPLAGAEYSTLEALADTWRAMDALVGAELAQSDVTVHEYLQARNPAWHAVGRVTFHLAEQKHNARLPFAFLATYADGVAASGRVRHLPLEQGAHHVPRGSGAAPASSCVPFTPPPSAVPFVKSLADSGELYEPLAWTPEDRRTPSCSRFLTATRPASPCACPQLVEGPPPRPRAGR